MKGKIAVVGFEDQILPFAAIGVKICAVENLHQAEQQVEELVDNEYVLIMITEDFARDMMKIRMKYAPKPVPTLISIPGKEGVTGSTLKQLSETLKYAVGADIMGEI